MTYRALLSDLDGTLLDTLKDIADSANEVLVRSGFPPHQIESYRYFVGAGMKTLACKALPADHHDDASVDEITALIEEEYSKRWQDNTRPYPGIPELLDTLTTSGIRMAILSNKPQGPVEQMVSALLSPWHFEIVAGARPSFPLKPDATAALQIARQMNLSPSEFLYMGDSAIDMQTASAAGMYPIGVLWGFRTADELLSGGAKVLIQKPSHLLWLLNE